MNSSKLGESRQAIDLLMCEKILLGLYPRLHFQAPTPLFNTLWNHTTPDLRRIVHLYCGDGLLTNWLALHFPKTEIIGIEPDRNKIAVANCSVGQRANIRFIAGDPRSMGEIPCERIIYSNPFSQSSQALAFKKMFMKTQSWLVNEGDWIIEESLSAAIFKGTLFNENLLNGESLFAQLNQALSELGYYKTQTLSQQSLFNLVTSTIIHARVQPPPIFDELPVKVQSKSVLASQPVRKASLQDVIPTLASVKASAPQKHAESESLTKGIHFGETKSEESKHHSSKSALDDIFALSSSHKLRAASPWDM